MLSGLALDPAERTWLAGVTATPGFGLTAHVPRWWRETRVRRSKRLTLAALGAAGEPRMLDYLRAVPGFTLFFVPEGLGFLDYIEAGDAPAHVHAIARFERAMWNVRLEPPAIEPADAVLRRHPGAAIVAFDADPEQVLGALLRGAPLPAPTGEPSHVLVAPGVAGWWRPASPEEARAFRACAPGTPVHVQEELPGGAETVAGLIAAGALIRPASPAH